MTKPTLGWLSIVRLGLVQASLGAVIALTTSTLNRVMVVEYALPASLPAALVAWHYMVQLSRPRWGYGADGGRRTPWIIVGMGVLALGTLMAANAAVMTGGAPAFGIAVAVVAFLLIGAGVAAAGTSLLALLATQVAPERRPAAASMTWIMMIVGIVLTTAITGRLLDPFSPQRLVLVASGVAGIAFVLTLIAVAGVERTTGNAVETEGRIPFRAALATLWAQPLARDFTIFVFVSMLAYSAQDLILEPFAGLLFGYSLGESTQLASVQHSGVLVGMILIGLSGTVMRGDRTRWMRRATFTGCAMSAVSLVLLAVGGSIGPTWPLSQTVFVLGLSNGVFAVSAIALMMSYAGEGSGREQWLRMGMWGAAQAMAFGLGGFAGAAGLDVMRSILASTPQAFAVVFALEAGLFVLSALLILRLARPQIAAPALHRFDFSVSRRA